MRKYIAAVAQIDTTAPWAENMGRIEGYIDDAASRGAKLIAFPESFSQYLGGRTPTEALDASPTVERMAAKAKEHSMWVLCGSIFTPSGKDARRSNTSVLLSPAGEIAATYEKMHMFDVTLPDGTTRLESDRFRPGDRIVTLDTELGCLGLSVCFDVRFPELYRIMALRGAQVLLIPSMFTKPTGRLCWEVLLRARAVENGCYVIAPNQIDGRFGSYGHSMIVDPSGKILCQIEEEEGIATAEIDLDELDRVRRDMPVLSMRAENVYRVEQVGH